jgi:hypothetical protein
MELHEKSRVTGNVLVGSVLVVWLLTLLFG